MATDLTDWSPDILPDIPTVPIVAIISAVRDAAVEFCEKTHLWKVDLTRISVVADTQDYTLTPPASSALVIVDNVKYKQNGQDDDQFVTLDPISKEQQNLFQSGNWIFATAPTPSQYWVDNVDKDLHLIPIPEDASTSGLLVHVVLKPSATCTTVPDFLYDDHRKAIASGALSNLYAKKGMSWYDPKEAQVYGAMFANDCNNAAIKRITGATKRPLRVQFRSWA